MLAGIVVKLVLDIDGVVVDGVVPGEELVTEGDVVAVVTGSVLDVDERELVGSGTADITDLGISGDELVRKLVGEAAVEVE